MKKLMSLAFATLVAQSSFAGVPPMQPFGEGLKPKIPGPVGVLAPTTFVGGDDVWADISQINYDTEWSGRVPGSDLNCTIRVDSFGDMGEQRSLNMFVYSKDFKKTIASIKAFIHPETRFTKKESASKVEFSEMIVPESTQGSSINIAILKNHKKSTATMIFKTALDTEGLACEVLADF